jgi:cytochrome c551/c552
MLHRLALVFALLALPHASGFAYAGEAVASDNRCVSCHAAMLRGFNTAHAFAVKNCAACHAGDPSATAEDAAHDGLIAFPGELATAERACGACHANRVAGVSGNLMNTGHGIVHKTRAVIDGAVGEPGTANLQSLGDGVADSLLRKQCASCHLGQPKTARALDVTRDRGGGCLACHVNDYPDNAHPALTVRVDDGRCFGCHSRSGRISLSYTGLAEVPPPDEPGALPELRLADGRPVERLPADVHYLAGMSCIDCHTSVGLMAAAGDAAHQREAVDVACTDCHGNGNPRLVLRDWPPELAGMRKHVPFAADAGTHFLTTKKHGTPLWHIELRDDGAWLHTKNTGRVLRIPEPARGHHGEDDSHERLTCATCHSQWAPQCFGCHLEFEQAGEQWDHMERAVTPGRWSDRFWHADNGLPALGVNEHDTVDVFVPGMIMTVAHPDLGEVKFLRRFAPLSPHTTGASRSCESCHRSSDALGLGKGDIGIGTDGIEFEPQQKRLQDGLPADAWTNVDQSRGGRATLPGQRPFTQEEMKAVLGAEIVAE